MWYYANFYSRPPLFTILLEHGIAALGTLKVNLKGIPSAMEQVKSLLKSKDTPKGKGYYIREDLPIVYCCCNSDQCEGSILEASVGGRWLCFKCHKVIWSGPLGQPCCP